VTDIGSLVVSVRGEPRELASDLTQAAQLVDRFTQRTEEQFAKVGTAVNVEQAVLALKKLGVQVKDLGRQSTGIQFFGALGADVEKAQSLLRALGVNAQVLAVKLKESEDRAKGLGDKLKTTKLPPSLTQQLAEADALLRARITLLTQGARAEATQAAALQALGTVYASVSRELAQGSVPLERRIALEKELGRVRAAFAGTRQQSTLDARALTAGAAIAQTYAQSLQRASAAQQQLAASSARANTNVGAMSLNMQRLTGTANRVANASIGVAFALEGILAGGDSAEKGVQKVLRAVAALGPAFGAGGLIVSGVAASLNAIVGMFNRTKQELEALHREFTESLNQMIDEADIASINREIKKIVQGVPSAGRGFGGFFKGSLEELRALESFLSTAVSASEKGTKAADKLEERFNEVRFAIGGARAKLDSFNAAIDAIAASKAGRDQFAKKITVNVQPALTSLEALQQRAKEVMSALEQQQADSAERLAEIQAGIFRDAQIAIPELPQEIARVYDTAIAMARKLDGVISPQANAVRALVRELRVAGEEAKRTLGLIKTPTKPEDRFRPLLDVPSAQLQKLLPTGATIRLPVTLIPPSSSDVLSITQAIERLNVTKGLLDFATATGDSKAIRQVSKDIDAQRQLLSSYGATVVEMFARGEISADRFRTIIEQVNAALGNAPEVSALGRNLDLAVQAGQGLLGVADAMGKVGDRARLALNGVLELTAAVRTLTATKAGLGGILTGGIAALGAIAQIGASLFGETEAQREANRLQRENNEVITRLSQDLRGFTSSLGGKLQIGRLASDPAALALWERATQTGRFTSARSADANKALEEFHRLLRANNLTYRDLDRAARDLGITLRDSAGRLVPGALKEFTDALGLNIKQLTTFGASLDEQRAKQQLRSEVFDITDTPTQRFNDAVALLTTQSTKLADAFKGIDVSTQAGRDAAEAVLRAFVEKIEQGQLTADDLAGFASKDEFIQFILDADKALDSFTESVDRATSQMQNVPKVLKLQQLAFQAQRFSSPLIPPTPTITTFDPNFARAPQVTPVETTNNNVTFSFGAGSVVIQAPAGTTDMQQAADQFLSVMQQRARSWFGDSRRWAEVQ
jgi:hypothetical protein